MTRIDTLPEDHPLRMTALVDCDSIVYAACAVGKDEEGNEVERYALANAKTMVKKILDRFQTEDNYRLFLGGKDNFRREIATILPYKGNRPPKPTFYDSVRSYLCDIWQAEIVDGMEAEDKLAIEYGLDPDNCVACHLDKDINQIAGHHYSYQKEEYYYISPLEANRNLWAQCIVGDKACDNILGIPGMGYAKAIPLLKNVTTYRQGYNIVKDEYFKAFGQQRCLLKPLKSGKQDKNGEVKMRWQFEKGEGLVRHDGTVIGWHDAFIENCRLVYLLREEGKHFEALN